MLDTYGQAAAAGIAASLRDRPELATALHRALDLMRGASAATRAFWTVVLTGMLMTILMGAVAVRLVCSTRRAPLRGYR